jgi:hypothetical protein
MASALTCTKSDPRYFAPRTCVYTPLSTAESFPVKLHMQTFRGEVAFLRGNEIIEAHALRGDHHILETRLRE